MIVNQLNSQFEYISTAGDWHLIISNGTYEISPQVGHLIYNSGVNLDNLAELIVSAKTHAIANGINWSNN